MACDLLPNRAPTSNLSGRQTSYGPLKVIHQNQEIKDVTSCQSQRSLISLVTNTDYNGVSRSVREDDRSSAMYRNAQGGDTKSMPFRVCDYIELMG